jgi:hypothetical protein
VIAATSRFYQDQLDLEVTIEIDWFVSLNLGAPGFKIVQSLRDEDYGQRHFFAVDPNGVLLDVIERIPPTPEWLAANGLA